MSSVDGLPARPARTFYNVADALIPPGPDSGLGAGGADLAPDAARLLRERGAGERRRFLWSLWCLEWQPVVTLRGRGSFSQLPRERRATILRGWQRSRLALFRRAFYLLDDVVREAWSRRVSG